MVPHADGSSQVLWEDGERVVRRGWRLDDNGKRRAVLTVLPAADTRASLDRLAHEYQLRDELDAAWALRPLELVSHAGRTMLVLEDAGGEPLDRLLGAPMEVGRFLSLAIAIAEALGKLHQRGLVHKDIKPANILVNAATGEVRLTGFGIASRLARERQSPDPPETIAGTLAYMAPEQTGRMNRSIDSRSDLYALGVTFYQMLTGALPFTAADPMEWVHCHIARQPVAPAERVKEIPGARLGDRHEAARQEGRGALSDRGRPRTRPSALPGRVGGRRTHPRLPARRTRHARPAADPREAVRARARDRRPWSPPSSASSRAARRSWCWYPAIPGSASRRSSTSCTRCWCRRAACLPRASSTSTSATSRMRPSRRPSRVSSVRSWARAKRSSAAGARPSGRRWVRTGSSSSISSPN